MFKRKFSISVVIAFILILNPLTSFALILVHQTHSLSPKGSTSINVVANGARYRFIVGISLGGYSPNPDGGFVYSTDGYKYQQSSITWEYPEADGVFNVEGEESENNYLKSLQWQTPITNKSYQIKVKGKRWPYGPGGGGPYDPNWESTARGQITAPTIYDTALIKDSSKYKAGTEVSVDPSEVLVVEAKAADGSQDIKNSEVTIFWNLKDPSPTNSGSGSLSASSTTTDSTGLAKVDLTCSNTNGDDHIVTAQDKSSEPSSSCDSGKAIVGAQIDLSAIDLYGTVAEGNEENPGAYVHYNIDNDNGNTSGGNPIADKDEDGPVSGENDLKQATITLKPSSLETGKVILKRSNTKVRTWKSSTKGGNNKILVDSNEKTWDLSDSNQRQDFNNVKNNLWVEGYQDNGSSNLTAEYRDAENNLVGSDTIKYTFIGAICGRQPTPSERNDAGSTFPNLIHCEWSITGEATPIYNCIAWSVGETTTWYVDVEAHRMHPYDIVIDNVWGNGDSTMTMAELDAFYDAKGYESTATGPNDADVMYYSGFHGARKKGCNCGAGKWIMFESKCGEWVRIEHVHNQLNGVVYGDPVRYYKHK